MRIGPTNIEESYAEAFSMRYARLMITAHDEYWVDMAVRELTGYGTSIIGCDVEAGVERRLNPTDTPDGTPGAAVLLFGFSTDALAKALSRRVGQCVMTCATTAVFDGLIDAAERVSLGDYLKFFGDGWQRCKVVGGRKFWRIPVSDGEFLVEATAGVNKGVAGGNLIIQATTVEIGLAAARRGVNALAEMPGVITPFPGGVVRSGSKVGSKYKKLPASTNDAYCPDLRTRVATLLLPETQCVYEIVLDGINEEAIRAGMAAAARSAAGEGVLAIGAANYGGTLGKFHFHLREILA